MVRFYFVLFFYFALIASRTDSRSSVFVPIAFSIWFRRFWTVSSQCVRSSLMLSPPEDVLRPSRSPTTRDSRIGLAPTLSTSSVLIEPLCAWAFACILVLKDSACSFQTSQKVVVVTQEGMISFFRSKINPAQCMFLLYDLHVLAPCFSWPLTNSVFAQLFPAFCSSINNSPPFLGFQFHPSFYTSYRPFPVFYSQEKYAFCVRLSANEVVLSM